MTKKQAKLKTTVATEPVALVADAPKPMVDLATLKTVVSPMAGSGTYYVIGAANDTVLISFRIWKEFCDKGFTNLAFRVRFGDKATGEPFSDQDIIDMNGLAKYWTGGSITGGHHSIQGGIKVQAEPWYSGNVITECRRLGYAAALHAALVTVLPKATVISLDAFESLFTQLVGLALKDVLSPEAKHANEQNSIRWGDGKVVPLLLIVNGSIITDQSVPAKSPAPALDKQPKVKPYAAPHPKDKIPPLVTYLPAPLVP